MALNLSKTVVNILKTHPNQGFTSNELAKLIYETKKDECVAKIKRTKLENEQQLIQQLAREISARTFRDILSDDIKVTAECPRKYFYEKEEKCKEEAPKKRKYEKREEELYGKVCQYLYSELNVYARRIDEKSGHNKEGKKGNIWLNPDIVGVKFLSEKWCSEVKNCVNKLPYNQTELWSFEVKEKITRSNLRENFFQTVSNSTWANYSYIVAKVIEEKAEDELRLLCKSYKIGVIILDDNLSESRIFIPAVRKEEVDWDMVNRITVVNDHFKEFINRITEFYQTGKIKKYEWNICEER